MLLCLLVNSFEGDPAWPVRPGGRVRGPSSGSTHSSAEDLVWPAVVEGYVDGKLASSSSGISSDFGSPKAKH